MLSEAKPKLIRNELNFSIFFKKHFLSCIAAAAPGLNPLQGAFFLWNSSTNVPQTCKNIIIFT